MLPFCVQVNVRRQLWPRLSDLILNQKEKRVHWDESCLKAVAAAMDEDGSAPDLFKEYLEYLEHSNLSGTASQCVSDMFIQIDL